MVANFIYNEFVVTTNNNSSLEKIIEKFRNTKQNEFPITFIAIEDNKCVGTISIFKNDLKTQNDLTPWLSALYVEPNYRKRGIAENLITTVLHKVKDLGYKTIYLRTEHTADYYKKLGWSFEKEAIDERGQATEVYKYDVV